MLKTLCSNVGIFLVLKIGEYSDLAILVSGMEGNSLGSNRSLTTAQWSICLKSSLIFVEMKASGKKMHPLKNHMIARLTSNRNRFSEWAVGFRYGNFFIPRVVKNLIHGHSGVCKKVLNVAQSICFSWEGKGLPPAGLRPLGG